MKYNVGDRVLIKSIDWYNENKDEFGEVRFFVKSMIQYCGSILTIETKTEDYYQVKENIFWWTDEMIEGLVKEETEPKYEDEVNGEYYSTPKYLVRPSGYQFVDENGNVINAHKIVLEKKKKEVILTQEQIDTMVHESCVLFCKHCGCGVPRETCTSLGSCKDHDEYRKSMRTYFETHKK